MSHEWFQFHAHVQVKVLGGRGKPSTVVDKDEGLGKVNSLELN